MPHVAPAVKASVWARLGAALVALAAGPAAADLVLPAGFVAQTYVTGQGFDAAAEPGGPGIPSIGTLAFDRAGTLYMAKTGARFRSGEVELCARLRPLLGDVPVDQTSTLEGLRFLLRRIRLDLHRGEDRAEE